MYNLKFYINCKTKPSKYYKPFTIVFIKSNNWSNAKEIITKRYEDFDFESLAEREIKVYKEAK